MINLIKKILTIFKKPLPIWVFILFLFILFIAQQLKHELSEALYDLTKSILFMLAGSACTIIVQITLEKRKNKNLFLINSNLVLQVSGRQYLQLANIKKEVETRIRSVNKHISEGKEIPCEELILMTQDFREDYYRIEIDKLTPLVRLPTNLTASFQESAQLVLSSDKNYYKTISSILKTNDSKQVILKDNQLPHLLFFYQKHMPSLLELVEYSLKINQKAMHSFQDEMKKIFGNEFKEFRYGEICAL